MSSCGGVGHSNREYIIPASTSRKELTMKKILIVALFLVVGTTVGAQDLQTRFVFHPTVDISDHWFLTGWAIGNAKLESPNNINLFGGVGYRKPKWWLEGMIQRQWSKTGNQLLLDSRFQEQIRNRTTLYVEVAPFLNKPAVYDFVILEYRTWRKINIGAETENAHKPGLDLLGGGPRISYPIGVIGKVKVTAALSYQMRRQERDALRFYFVLNRRFMKK